MGKLNLTIDLDNLTEKEREKFFNLVEKSKKKTFNPFERVEKGGTYYTIGEVVDIKHQGENNHPFDETVFKRHNYFNDEEFAQHQALRELLNRKLIKFSYENGGAEIDSLNHAQIVYDKNANKFYTNTNFVPNLLTPLFVSDGVAKRAIDEVVKPFLEEHPDFKWWG